ncbi:MAG: DUF1330 domain-containing protein [bacterium]|nr:DUF1330 domain-containing protein [Gammaproteobacteria bacterium]HIL95126.1 DUF1330 domain-containing protein [Pseudomonadales bacterium]
MKTCAGLLLTILLVGCDSRIANHVPGSNPWLDGNLGQFAEFARVADEGPVVMINLLKFTEEAKDGSGTGAASYAKYGELATPFVEKHGGKLIWSGVPTQQLVGDMDYDWDMVLLVWWPKRQNLLDLGSDEGYEAIAHHRMDGLERTMLIALDETYPLYGQLTEK